MVVVGDRLDISRPFDEDVVIVPAYTPGEPYTVDRRQADTPFHLTLKGALAESWEEAKKRAAWTGSAVGMHFRSMTGEFVERMNRFVIPDFDARVDAIRNTYIDTARSLADAAGLQDPAHFVASDDTGFIDYMQGRLGRVVTTGSQIPTRPDQSWAQHLAENNFDLSILADAVNDLWFLSECDAIVRSPNSGYSKFAILNSQKITASRIVDVPVPSCAEIFASLQPDVAVNWTRVALREAQARRVRDAYPYQWFIDALERAGRSDEAQNIRKLANWQWEATYSPAVNVPGEQWNPGDLSGEKLNAAIAIVRRVAERLPNNPYVLAGYPPRSLADLLAEADKLDEAIAVAERAIEMEPEDGYLRRHLGQLLMKGGRFDAAENALRRAVALVPDDGALFGEYAQCLISLDRIPEAIRMLRVAIALRPDRLQWRLELSRILVGTGAFDQAKAALMDGLPADVRRPEVLHALSSILEKAGKRREATDAIGEACELEPHVLQWKYRLGELCVATGDADRAIQTFGQILKIVPDSAHANHAISILYQGKGKLDEALEAARRALANEPDAPHRHARVGEVLLYLGELEVAEQTLRTAVGLRDESPETRFVQSNVLERLGRLPEALASARRATEIAPSDQRWQSRVADLSARVAVLSSAAPAPDAPLASARGVTSEQADEMIRQARAAQAARDWEQATRCWEEVRRHSPGNSIGYANAVVAYRELRCFDEAEAIVIDAVRRFPNDAAVFIEFARVPFVQGLWPEAGRRWAEVMRRFPEQSAGYLGMAAALRNEGHVDDAEAVLRSALEHFPDEPGPPIEYAWLVHHKKDWPEASLRWRHVRTIHPGYLHAYTTAAVAFWEQGQLDDADKLLREAMERFPNDPTPLVNFAELAVRQNDWQQAMSRWMEVGRRFPDYPDHAHRIHIARMRLIETDPAAAADFDAAVEAGTAHVGPSGAERDPEMREVMLAFESLGGLVGGCEFGGVQRAFGAETLDLLRWADMVPDQLVAALEAHLEGVGSPEQTELRLQNNGGRNEYCTRDRRFGMAMHTFIHEDEISFEKMFVQSCRRLRYLASKLLDDLRTGSKIFVYKTTTIALRDDEIEKLYLAMRQFPKATLLYVRLEDATHKHGTVEVVKPGLMIGYIDQFSAAVPGGRLTDTSSSWVPVCRTAFRLWKSAYDKNLLELGQLV